MMLRITSLKFTPPVEKGYKRAYEQCHACGRVIIHDYVPFSLSTPIITMPCGHLRDVRTLDEQTGMRLLLEQRIAKEIA